RRRFRGSYHRPYLELLESRWAPSATNVTTWHNDNVRDGINSTETVLTPANVSPSTFAKLFAYPVDGYTYAQPLYMRSVSIPSRGTHNVIYVATEHDSVYALDADNPVFPAGVLWQDSFVSPANGITTVPFQDTGITDIVPEVGITGTPVIDTVNSTLYVV